MRVSSFAPLIAKTPPPHVLVLGSMPSAVSLAEQAYYAHPRNAFWKIMARLFEFDSDLPYKERVRYLQKNHLALWDVYRSCERAGSLDSNIKNAEPNDVCGLLARFDFKAVWLNGGKARTAFMKEVGASFAGDVISLPSTSPAHAKMNFQQKYEAWRAAWQKVF